MIKPPMEHAKSDLERATTSSPGTRLRPHRLLVAGSMPNIPTPLKPSDAPNLVSFRLTDDDVDRVDEELSSEVVLGMEASSETAGIPTSAPPQDIPNLLPPETDSNTEPKASEPPKPEAEAATAEGQSQDPSVPPPSVQLGSIQWRSHPVGVAYRPESEPKVNPPTARLQRTNTVLPPILAPHGGLGGLALPEEDDQPTAPLSRRTILGKLTDRLNPFNRQKSKQDMEESVPLTARARQELHLPDPDNDQADSTEKSDDSSELPLPQPRRRPPQLDLAPAEAIRDAEANVDEAGDVQTPLVVGKQTRRVLLANSKLATAMAAIVLASWMANAFIVDNFPHPVVAFPMMVEAAVVLFLAPVPLAFTLITYTRWWTPRPVARNYPDLPKWQKIVVPVGGAFLTGTAVVLLLFASAAMTESNANSRLYILVLAFLPLIQSGFLLFWPEERPNILAYIGCLMAGGGFGLLQWDDSPFVINFEGGDWKLLLYGVVTLFDLAAAMVMLRRSFLVVGFRWTMMAQTIIPFAMIAITSIFFLGFAPFVDTLSAAQQHPESAWMLPVHVIMLCGIVWAIGSLSYTTDSITFGCTFVLSLIGTSSRFAQLLQQGSPVWGWILTLGCVLTGSGALLCLWRAASSEKRNRETYQLLGVIEAKPEPLRRRVLRPSEPQGDEEEGESESVTESVEMSEFESSVT